jgi:membrane protease YdiL (CAAX protease family)
LILNTPLKYFILLLLTFAIVLVYGGHPWIEIIKQGFPLITSIAIFYLIIIDLWSRRTKINFVFKTYFKSGILAYLRACLIVVITIISGSIIYMYVPEFLKLGWGNLIFGNSGNLALQPIQTAYETTQKLNELQGNKFDYGWLFLLPVWMSFILMLPFWAETEEKIFRKGVHSWKKIAINSLIFGLIHLTMGIPICWALTLAIPGFLFACRYKYVYHRHLRKFHDEEKAQAAGVEASTADHAIYNAILITLSVAGMLLLK